VLSPHSNEDETTNRYVRPRRWWHTPEFRTRRQARRFGFLSLLGASCVFGILCGLMVVYAVHLPQMDELERYHPSTTTDLYDVHGKVFGSFAIERRIVVTYDEFPPVLRQAIFSIEDKNFETNGGINLVRAVGAAYHDLHSHGKAQGASTLTMQLSRNLFLTPEKTYTRKLEEIMLTLQIERRFTKQQIFTLYANQIYLGRGTYGFEAGSEYYFSKHARELTLPEAALLAGLPKGPEEFSPIRHAERALRRRNLVIAEMLDDGKITREEASAATAAPLGLHVQAPVNSEAPYFVEEVRRQLEEEYGVEEAHGAGLKVYTTLDLDLQHAANQSLLDGLAAYERRHGWRPSRLPNVLAASAGNLAEYHHPDWSQPLTPDSYIHALVTQVTAAKMTVKLGSASTTMTPADWAWTQKFKATDLVHVGDIVYVKVVSAPTAGGSAEPAADAVSAVKNLQTSVSKPLNPAGPLHVVLEQDSGAQGALMAVDNANGEVVALVGGRDFNLSQFNRATQAQRQVGSSFKPYVYTTAMEGGMKPTDIVMDAPTTFSTPSGPYTPHNYESNYLGAMTLTSAFAESRNIPALRLASKFGIKAVIATARRFGVTSPLPEFLPVAIGAADITLAEQVGAYSVFPNDGIRIAPHFIRKVIASDGSPLQEATPQVSEAISVQTARQMMVLLQAVVTSGTGAAASQLQHPLGGKTGTTNNYTDAWFVGFSPSVTCGTWVGFDTRESLGEKETGAKAALPIWMGFMKAAIADHPNESFSRANAPKKKLEVDVNSDADAATAAPAAMDADTDSDTGESDDRTAPAAAAAPAPGVPAAPSPAAPSVPDGQPSVPPKEAGDAGRKGATAPRSAAASTSGAATAPGPTAKPHAVANVAPQR
jgi:penicillin-binding protein 1A